MYFIEISMIMRKSWLALFDSCVTNAEFPFRFYRFIVKSKSFLACHQLPLVDFVCLTKNIHYFVSTYFHLHIILFSKLELWPLIKVSILGVESLLPFHAWLFRACKTLTYLIITKGVNKIL